VGVVASEAGLSKAFTENPGAVLPTVTKVFIDAAFTLIPDKITNTTINMATNKVLNFFIVILKILLYHHSCKKQETSQTKKNIFIKKFSVILLGTFQHY
jgi:hypothetical protein